MDSLRKFEHSLDGTDLARLSDAEFRHIWARIPSHAQSPFDTSLRAVSSEFRDTIIGRDILGAISLAKRRWVVYAEDILRGPRAKWNVDDSLKGWGLLTLLSEDAEYLVNSQTMRQILFRASEPEAPEEAKHAARHAQNEVLRAQVLDCATTTMLWENSVRFIEAFAIKEPRREDVEAYMADMDFDLRRALKIQKASKYAMKIKPVGWRNDVVRFFTVTYLATLAWCEI
jgi:hypothetical protein